MPKSIRKRRSLIASPLSWQMNGDPVAPPVIPVLAERGGTQLKTPRPVLLVDTREQIPLDFSRFESWFAGIERKALKLGDYSIAGMEEICVVERKELPDLVHSCTTDRCVHQPAATDGAMPTPPLADHKQPEPNQVALFSWRQSKPNHSILDCHAGGPANPVPMQRDA